MISLNGLQWFLTAGLFLAGLSSIRQARSLALQPHVRPGHPWTVRGHRFVGIGSVIMSAGVAAMHTDHSIIATVVLTIAAGIMGTAAYSMHRGNKVNEVDVVYREEMRRRRPRIILLSVFLPIAVIVSYYLIEKMIGR